MATAGRALRRLGPADYAILTEAVVLALGVELALRLMPFSRLLEHATRERRRPDTPTSVDACSHAVWAASAAYRLLPIPRSCLRESLVLSALLGRRGQPARVCVGVRKEGGGIAAHAWVESPGIAGDVARPPFHALGPWLAEES